MASMEEIQKRFKVTFEELGKVIVGQEEVLKQVLITILCDSNALIESVPGLAKTLSIKTIADIMDLKFSRIQATPDLLPSDITGTYIIEEEKGQKRFKFQEGPIFANIVLVDEINRATPKTQSATLEAMQEKQVTVGNTSFKLPEPFFILATENPIEQEGSLALDQYVFVNGELKTGEELLASAICIFEDEKGIKTYDLGDSWTYSLNEKGKLEKQKCLLYTLPYTNEIINITSRSRREISVTKNHPFLVNDKGEIKWKKAEELTKEDYLICPAKIPEFSEINYLTHKETIARIKQKPIKEIIIDKDFAFWIGFVISDGHIGPKVVSAVQKNYPAALDRFIAISREKYGFKVGIEIDKTGCREARIYSKPLVEYLKIRFGMKIGKEKEIPASFLGWKEELTKEFLKVFIALEGNLDSNRITFTQKKKRDVNILRYMLLRLGIITWSRDKRINRFRIQGEDTGKYLKNIEWIAEQNKINPNRKTKSSFRVVPVDRQKILKAVELLGINSFHTLQERGKKITERTWYGSYKGIKEGEIVMSRDSLRLFIDDIKKEIVARKTKNFKDLTEKDPRRFAAQIGLPITTISKELKISNSQIWRLYKNGNSRNTVQIIKFIEETYESRIIELDSIITYLEGLLSEDICYEKIKSIEYIQSSGMAFGLTVPEKHNYIAGFGACGINHNTYALPEAQSDRFLLKILMDYPSFQEELEVTNRYAEEVKIPTLRKVFNKESIQYLQQVTRQMPIARDLKAYAVKIVTDTRTKKNLIEYGASPRASIGLILAAKAMALIEGRKYVSKKDIDTMAYPILRHRIILNFEAQRNNLTPDDVIKQLLK